ncbi:uncharacterized protein EV154DRAFT_324303 [Mucor mucedo]|uniref:uncharacterized protein n=1 Tax=Mucor mucedo TaxID=29922 RepID=UPI00222022BC|nr:uncharacterized protein EV154DRAFT_324303 [Mucor mucedo]KAI7888041.1 hypothetical protein EV154DRAFT_324303 [Mucor mucedo]
MKVKVSSTKLKIDDVFSMDHRPSAGNEEDSIAIHQHVYVNCFLIAYLYSLNKFIEEKLDEDYGDEWKNKNIAFTVSVDKYLLDKVFGSKERLNELFYASGVLQKDNRLRKAQIFSYGEEILPAIQQRLTDLDFKMKSYFVVAQIHPKHIQLTLHQVVKLSSYEENTATIIIQDEIVQIEDVYDSLSHCFGYKNVYQKLKLCVVEIMNSNITSLDMKFKNNFNIGNDCDCKTVLFLRNIIEIGLKPVLQNIATIIASSMNNATLFSNYELDYLFVIGNVFDLPYKSAIYYTYIKLVQEAINISIESKEKDTKGIVLHESFRHLLEQVTTHKKPYMFDRFSIGTLGQVFRETYGIRFLTWRISSYIPFSCTDFNEDGKNTLVENGSFLVVVQKGQPVPITGLALEFELYFKERLDDSLRAGNYFGSRYTIGIHK